jgi:hypothetical protein
MASVGQRPAPAKRLEGAEAQRHRAQPLVRLGVRNAKNNSSLSGRKNGIVEFSLFSSSTRRLMIGGVALRPEGVHAAMPCLSRVARF